MLKRKIVKVAYLKELEDKVDALTRKSRFTQKEYRTQNW